MAEEKRMAGDYTILQSMFVGSREVVMGENPAAEPGHRYMCAFCESNSLVRLYNEVVVSGDFSELVDLYARRILELNEQIKSERQLMTDAGVDLAPLSPECCQPVSCDDDLNGKVLVIRAERLCPEYRVSACQLVLCTGGSGARAKSRGSSVFCKDLFFGASARYERSDFLGAMERNALPEWAKPRLAQIEPSRPKKDRGGDR